MRKAYLLIILQKNEVSLTFPDTQKRSAACQPEVGQCTILRAPCPNWADIAHKLPGPYSIECWLLVLIFDSEGLSNWHLTEMIRQKEGGLTLWTCKGTGHSLPGEWQRETGSEAVLGEEMLARLHLLFIREMYLCLISTRQRASQEGREPASCLSSICWVSSLLWGVLHIHGCLMLVQYE